MKYTPVNIKSKKRITLSISRIMVQPGELEKPATFLANLSSAPADEAEIKKPATFVAGSSLSDILSLQTSRCLLEQTKQKQWFPKRSLKLGTSNDFACS